MKQQMWIGGEWVNASNGQTRDVINPADGSVLARVPEATKDDVAKAVSAARAAFDDVPWPKSQARDRGTVLFKVA